MSCEGVWKVEMKGPYGWERIATGFMRDGEYLGASADHYAVGSYKEDGDNLEMSMVVKQYGAIRTIFGRKSADKLQIISQCKIKKNKIICTSKAKGIKNFDIQLRYTRLDSLE